MKKICMLLTLSSLLGLAPMMFGMIQFPIPTIVLEEEHVANYLHFPSLNNEQKLNQDQATDKKDFETLREMAHWARNNGTTLDEIAYRSSFDVIINSDKKSAKIEKQIGNKIVATYSFHSLPLLALFGTNQTIIISRA